MFLFYFLLIKFPIKRSNKIEPNIYGTSNVSYLLKMKQLSNTNQQQHQQSFPQKVCSQIHPNTKQISSSNQNLAQYQSDRDKYFAEYIKNNGDAATQIISNFLYLGGHRQDFQKYKFKIYNTKTIKKKLI